jgi:membrane protease YdiL (CAAX protease family)
VTDTIAGWLLALAIGALLVPFAARGSRSAAVGCWALLLLYVVALAVADWLLDPHWRPSAPALAALAVWLAIQPLRSFGSLTAESLGLVPPRPDSVRPAAIVTCAAIALNLLVLAGRGLDPLVVSTSTMVAVMVAAIVEELVMRGVLLSLADQAIPPRWRLWGARIGPGGLLLTGAFVALHGARPGVLLGVAPAALLYLWLRARTGSLVAPIIAHLLWNLSVIMLHR